MSSGRNSDDAGRSGGLDLVQEQVGEEKVAKVVSANLHLETVLSLHVGAHHNPGIVDQDIDGLLLGIDLLGTFAH